MLTVLQECVSVLSNDDWPKFISIEASSPDLPITMLSPFAIQKGIAGIAGRVKEVKKIRNWTNYCGMV